MRTTIIQSLFLAGSIAMGGAAAQADCLIALPFASGSATLSQGNQSLLSQLIANYPSARVSISGHTDATGAAATNAALSRSRVDAVQSYLRSNGGRGMEVVSTSAEASRVPRDISNLNSQLNRRAEVFVPGCDPTLFAGNAVAVAPGGGLLQGGLAGAAGPGVLAGLTALLIGVADGTTSSTTTSTN